MAESHKKKAKESEAPKKKPAAAKPAPRKKKEVKEVVKEAVKEVKAAKAEATVEKPAVVAHAAPPPPPAPVHHAAKPKKAKSTAPKYYGTGRRKEAIAKVWITPGTGKITVNDRPYGEYFCGRKLLENYINRPLVATQNTGKFDVMAEVFGGGVPGQATAVSLGIARALVELNHDLKTTLKRQGLMTRDPRMRERKKYGRKRARRAFQYTKR